MINPWLCFDCARRDGLSLVVGDACNVVAGLYQRWEVVIVVHSVDVICQ